MERIKSDWGKIKEKENKSRDASHFLLSNQPKSTIGRLSHLLRNLLFKDKNQFTFYVDDGALDAKVVHILNEWNCCRWKKREEEPKKKEMLLLWMAIVVYGFCEQVKNFIFVYFLFFPVLGLLTYSNGKIGPSHWRPTKASLFVGINRRHRGAISFIFHSQTQIKIHLQNIRCLAVIRSMRRFVTTIHEEVEKIMECDWFIYRWIENKMKKKIFENGWIW